LKTFFLGAILGFLIAVLIKYALTKTWFLQSDFWNKSFMRKKNIA